MIKTDSQGSIRKVTVTHFNPEWVAGYEREAQALQTILGDEIAAIHHIGSTSIPGILAKPIIDILLEVRSIDRLPAFDAHLRERGYRPKGEFGLPGRQYYPKNTFGLRTHQLHAWQHGNEAIVRHLAFRDYLIAHPAAAAEYGRFKSKLVERFEGDRERYVEGKHNYVQRLEQRALAWQALFQDDHIQTERLRLIPLTIAQLRFGLQRRYLLENELGVRISAAVFSKAATSAIKTKLHRMTRTESHSHVWDTYWLMIVDGAKAGVGLIGFKGAPNNHQIVELGYGVEPEWRGQGVASEATQAMINWALDKPTCDAVSAWTEKDNVASMRVLKKAGLINLRERSGQYYWLRRK